MPLKVYHVNLQNSPLYWKGCGRTANIMYCWWQYAVIKQFWMAVLCQIELITKILRPFQCAVLPLNFGLVLIFLSERNYLNDY